MSPSHISRCEPAPDGAPRRWPTGLAWEEHVEPVDTRPIKVEIRTWIGHAPEATHFKLDIEEEKNCWWSEEDDAWISVYTDTGAIGLSVKACLQTYEACVDLSISALLAIAGKAGVKKRPIRWDDCRNGDKIPTKVLKALKRKKSK
jgi:hypothetical protein